MSHIAAEADAAITHYLDAVPDRSSAYHRDADYHHQVEQMRAALAEVALLLNSHGTTDKDRARTLRVLLAGTGETLTAALDASDVHASLSHQQVTALRHAVYGAAGVMAGAHYDAVNAIGRIMIERHRADADVTRLCTVLLDGPGDHTAALARIALRADIAHFTAPPSPHPGTDPTDGPQ